MSVHILIVGFFLVIIGVWRVNTKIKNTYAEVLKTAVETQMQLRYLVSDLTELVYNIQSDVDDMQRKIGDRFMVFGDASDYDMP
jgi:uncharacterized protein YoxC